MKDTRYRLIVSMDIYAKDDKGAIQKGEDWIQFLKKNYDNRPMVTDILENKYGKIGPHRRVELPPQ